MGLPVRLGMLWCKCSLVVLLSVILSGCGGVKGVDPPATPTAPPVAPTASMTAVPAEIDVGQIITLTWQTTNASSVEIDGFDVKADGSRQLTPASSITYQLTAKGAGGTAQANAAVTVNTSPNAPTAQLNANPTLIVSGQSTTTLTWQTTNATSVSISGIGTVPASGSQQLSPTSTTTYTLTAQGAAGTTQAAATVTVDPYPIKHVVIIFQENRSADNLFHDSNLIANGADIASTGLNSEGQTIQLTPRPLADDYDLAHNHENFVQMYDGGKMDGADKILAVCSGGGQACLPPNPQFVYVNPSDVAPYFQMAETYTFADRMFQTNQGPSFPAHQFIFSATSAPTETSDLFAADNPVLGNDSFTLSGCIAQAGTTVAMIDPTGSESSFLYPCFEHATLSDLLDTSGISWRYYSQGFEDIWVAPNAINHICQPSLPTGGVCTGPDWNTKIVKPPAQVLTDIANGNLAAVSWITPPGMSSDHPGANDGTGPSWVSSVVNAIGTSPYWSDTAIFITWDDWGGLYDHVAPPIINSYEYGFRVPLIVVSPYAKAGYISHVTHDFGSVVRFIEQSYGLPSLGFADSIADDFSDSFDFTQTPLVFQQIPAVKDREFFLHDKRPDVPLDDD
jgi:phospholipase C